MTWCRLFLATVVAAALAVPAEAGIFFGKKARPNAAERVPVLIMALKAEADEHRRASAANELQQFEGNTFPEIVPALIEAALHDPKPSVRLDAVDSLGHIRPVSQQVGWALEQVLAQDGNFRVRLGARTSLWQYHLSGYHGPRQAEPTIAAGDAVRTSEPPLDMSGNGPPPLHPVPVMTPAGAPESMPAQPVTAIPVGQPLPPGPPQPEVTPMEPPLLETPPASDGPDLTPPE